MEETELDSSVKRNLVIGLDGFELSVAKALADAGKLPFFSRLFEETATFDLDHGDARDTGLAWEHFATGQHPDDYRRWSAVTFNRHTYQVLQSPSEQKPFTNELGGNVVVFDTPYHTLENRSQCPSGVVDWGAHDPGVPTQSNPASLLHEIESRFGRYPAKQYIYGFSWPCAQRTQRMAESLLEAAKVRTGIANWLLEERFPDWETAIIVTSELHSSIEAFWHGWDTLHPLNSLPSAAPALRGIESLYVETDRMLSLLARRFPDARFVVFAMHGMGSNTADVLSMAVLPEFMYRMETGRTALSSRADWQVSSGFAMRQQEDWSMAVNDCLTLPERQAMQSDEKSRMARLKALFRTSTSGSRARPAELSLDWMPSALYAPAWRKMRAFALPSFYDGQIRVNLSGREAEGVVAGHDYERELDRIEAELNEMRDLKTGRKVVASISRPVTGRPFEAGPTECDLRISWASSANGIRHSKMEPIGPFPFRRTGGHTGKCGFAALMNCGLQPGFKGSRSAMDVAPTLAKLATGFSGTATFSGKSLLD